MGENFVSIASDDSDSEYLFQCELCRVVLASEHSLVYHCHEVHQGKGLPALDEELIKPDRTEALPSLENVTHTSNSTIDIEAATVKRPYYTCILCLRAFYNKIGVSEHIRNRHFKVHSRGERDIDKCHCQFCAVQFDTWNAALSHMCNGSLRYGVYPKPKKHTPSRKLKKCTICETFCVGEDEYKEHMLNLHGYTRSHECEVCGKIFKTIGAMYDHRRMEHPSIKSQCYVCKKYYPGTHSLKLHKCTGCDPKTLTSPGAGPKVVTTYKCRICKGEFNSKVGLNVHFRVVHKGNGIYKCYKCDEEFRSEALLFAHTKSVHPDAKERCKYCHKIVYGRVGLTIHRYKCRVYKMRDRHGAAAIRKRNEFKKLQLLTCRICLVDFHGLSSLGTHFRNSHPNDKIHMCYDCGESFSSISDYVCHREMQHTAHASTCPLCNIKFQKTKDILEHACSAIRYKRSKQPTRDSIQETRDDADDEDEETLVADAEAVSCEEDDKNEIQRQLQLTGFVDTATNPTSTVFDSD